MQQKYLTQYDDLYDDFHIVRFPPLSSCARGCWNTLFYIGRQLLFQFSGAAFTRTTPCNAQMRRPLQKDMSTWSGIFLSHCLDDALMKCAPDTKLLGHLCLRCHVRPWHGQVRLPLTEEEIRGVPALSDFARHMLQPYSPSERPPDSSRCTFPHSMSAKSPEHIAFHQKMAERFSELPFGTTLLYMRATFHTCTPISGARAFS